MHTACLLPANAARRAVQLPLTLEYAPHYTSLPLYELLPYPAASFPDLSGLVATPRAGAAWLAGLGQLQHLRRLELADATSAEPVALPGIPSLTELVSLLYAAYALSSTADFLRAKLRPLPATSRRCSPRLGLHACNVVSR